jgi:dipeptidase D
MSAIESLEPRPVWQIFAGLSAVPRPSKKEGRIRQHLKEVAEARGWKTEVDAIGNLVVKVPATPGHESAPAVVLQAHMDMVTEKNSGTVHDFENEGIHLLVDKDAAGETIVRADGTTLGADNGIGVALAFAAGASGEKDVVHGPLELLITVDEEEGMSGAANLDPSLLAGRVMLNLDTEEDHSIYIGCAGGCYADYKLSGAAEPLAGRATFKVSVSGLRGGHSGGDIHEGRGAATILLARTLAAAGSDFAWVEADAGSKLNAIPREAWAIVAGGNIPGGGDLKDNLEDAAARIEAEGRAESFEPGLEIKVEKVDLPAAGALPAAESRRLLQLLLALPQGVIGMHPKIPSLVETSNNVATLKSRREDGRLEFLVGLLARSSAESRMEELVVRLESLAALAGAEVKFSSRYPGWAPNLDSPVLALCRRVHEDLFGKQPKVAAVHAGLECGILGERVPGLDMVSIGPRIEGAHSPDERVWVSSVGKSWDYLKALLAELAKP